MPKTKCLNGTQYEVSGGTTSYMTTEEQNLMLSPNDRNELLGSSGVKNSLQPINTKEIFPEFIGKSPKMVELLKKVHKAARTDSPVLIYGASGTGKELVASAVHRLSSRSAMRFVPINCSAIPEDLLETELFGHEKGAFTGATQKRKGHFEVARGGTIFLDEIGDMPPKLQVKLLRVLQEKQFSPVGSNSLIEADVRIVAATNVNLEKAVEDKTFRLDLYYRLNVLPVTVPALKDREGDVECLMEYFLDYHNMQHRLSEPCYFSEETIKILKAYEWPGNVRELQNMIERIVVMVGGGRVCPSELPEEILRSFIERSQGQPAQGVSTPSAPVIDFNRHSAGKSAGVANGQTNLGDDLLRELPLGGVDLMSLVETLENNYILQALERTNYNKNQAAKLLGINRTTLVERIKKRKLVPLNQPSREL